MRKLLASLALLGAAAQAPSDPFAARMRFDDVDLFYRVYDSAAGHPDAAQLRRGYIEAASAGVREFVPNRIVSPEALAAKIAAEPALYERARLCRAALPDATRRVRAAYLALQEVLPEARLPDVTVLIGRGNSGGTSGPSGVLIGLEVVCDPGHGTMPLDVRFTHLVAHELAHTQQTEFSGDTLLAAALNEGVAEFVGELISAAPANADMFRRADARAPAIERAFAAEMRGTAKGRWLYNGQGTPEWPGDLGYWAGYRVARRYFERATDKRAAVRAMLRGGMPRHSCAPAAGRRPRTDRPGIAAPRARFRRRNGTAWAPRCWARMADLTLNDDNSMPQLGFGTWRLPDAQAPSVVRDALDVGYRLIDTAAIYGNERGVGEGVRGASFADGGAFITTKLWNDRHGDAEAALGESLALLGLDAVDLYLIHWPRPGDGRYVEAWRAMIRLQQAGLARSIGVSNFEPEHLDALIGETRVVPAVNQVELHPRFQQRALRAYHERHNIVTQSWSPLGQGGALLQESGIVQVAAKHGCTPAQAVIAWHLAHGLSVIPKAADPAHMRENFAAQDVRLDADDMAAIDALDSPEGRIGPHPTGM